MTNLNFFAVRYMLDADRFAVRRLQGHVAILEHRRGFAFWSENHAHPGSDRTARTAREKNDNGQQEYEITDHAMFDSEILAFSRNQTSKGSGLMSSVRQKQTYRR